MTESEARAALLEMGIKNPSRSLLEDYIRAQSAQAWALEVPERSSVELAGERSQPNSAPKRTERPHPSSESTLEPTLRERGELQRPAGRRKPGRPKVIAPWFHALAVAMSDGTTLRRALSILGIYGLSDREIRALYRNTALRAMREAERQRWLREFGVHSRKPRHRGVKTGLCKDGDCMGQTWQFRRTL